MKRTGTQDVIVRLWNDNFEVSRLDWTGTRLRVGWNALANSHYIGGQTTLRDYQVKFQKVGSSAVVTRTVSKTRTSLDIDQDTPPRPTAEYRLRVVGRANLTNQSRLGWEEVRNHRRNSVEKSTHRPRTFHRRTQRRPKGIDDSLRFHGDGSLLPQPEPVTVDYASCRRARQRQPSDYTATSGTLTFARGPKRPARRSTVPIESTTAIEDHGETLTVTLSNPTGGAGNLDGEAIGTIQNTEDEDRNPRGHRVDRSVPERPVVRTTGNDDAFDVRILFDAALSGSWTSVRDAITVTNGTHTKTHRVDGRSDLWNIGVEATSDADVTVSLAASVACGETGALCTSDSRRFETAISTVIDGPEEEEETTITPVTPLTASFSGMPSTHNGSTAFKFKVRFSEELTSYSYRTLRDHSVRVTQGGTTTGASSVRRMVQRQERLLGSHCDTEGCRRHLHCLGANHRLRSHRGDVHRYRRQPSGAHECTQCHDCGSPGTVHRRRNGRRSRQRNGRLRSHPVEGSFGNRNGGVRNVRRDGS